MFYNCASLASITIPDSITKIDSSAFFGCTSLNNITIPNYVTSIGSHAFYGCTILTSMTILATTPPTLGNNYSLPGTSIVQAIYVPAESVDTYKAANRWSTYASMIQAIPNNS